MTRKDFQLVADVFKRQQSVFVPKSVGWHAVRATAASMADALATTNINFKRERFMTACGF